LELALSICDLIISVVCRRGSLRSERERHLMITAYIYFQSIVEQAVNNRDSLATTPAKN
jgi:hypothetical protein